ncbi:MAG: hypothetical protein WCV84_04290 [Patescibacteria group bacterium]
MKKLALLLGYDAAGSTAFKLVAGELVNRDYEVDLLVGNGQQMSVTDEELEERVKKADAVFLYMSTTAERARIEILAANLAKKYGKPYGFYGDIVQCWGRARPGAWFEPVAADAAFYCGVNEEDSQAAGAVFPNAMLFGTGNPVREDWHFPKTTYKEVRETLGIDDDTFMVLLSLNKQAAHNTATMLSVFRALSRLITDADGKKHPEWYRLVIGLHPGDPQYPVKLEEEAADPTTPEGLLRYLELLELCPVPVTFMRKGDTRTSDLVPGADIVVGLGSAVELEAAFQGKPVITYGFEQPFRLIETANGTRNLENVSSGASELVVASVDKFTEAMRRLLTRQGYEPMRARQAALFPKPKERGTAVRNIANVLEVFLPKH